MRLRTSTIQARHLTPRCLDCGAACHHPGPQDRCPGCGSDLRERPARSYAEMEGLVEVTPAPMRHDALREWRETQVLERWLLTAFATALLLAFGAHAVGALLSA